MADRRDVHDMENVTTADLLASLEAVRGGSELPLVLMAF